VRSDRRDDDRRRAACARCMKGVGEDILKEGKKPEYAITHAADKKTSGNHSDSRVVQRATFPAALYPLGRDRFFPSTRPTLSQTGPPRLRVSRLASIGTEFYGERESRDAPRVGNSPVFVTLVSSSRPPFAIKRYAREVFRREPKALSNAEWLSGGRELAIVALATRADAR